MNKQIDMEKRRSRKMIKSVKLVISVFSIFLLFLIWSFFGGRIVLAQNDFEEVEGLLNRARDEGAELLSPKNLQAASDEYQKAVELRDKGKSLKDINKRLEKAKQVSQSVLNNIKLAEITFAKVLPEREKAIQAKAAEFVSEQWIKVEEEFRKAVVSLEDGKVKQAKSKVEQLVELFQDVELAAIKEDITGSAISHSTGIEKEVSGISPRTFQKGLTKIEEAIGVLEVNRYAREDAEALIKEAEYNLRHSLSLKERILESKGKDMETILLDFEGDLERISEGLGMEMRFDGEIEDEIAKMVEMSTDLQLRNRELSSELYTLKEEMAESQELKESLQSRLDEEKRKRDRLNRVQGLFKTSEVKVFRDDLDNIVLRLVGFSFTTGSDTIDPGYFDLLSRVQEALNMFPQARVVIEGHTDSMGDERHNRALSQNRANAIHKYLVANLALDTSMVTAVGHGEERPIANNETEKGRTLNRRVDIVIMPSG
jgi:outer membrane protein OmpA-like peptidoglycan-associated protein